MTTKSELASAKIEMLLAIALDDGLSKLAIRAAGLLCGRYIHFDKGATARAAVSTYCSDLGIASHAKVSVALGSLVQGRYLLPETTIGKPTRYVIHPRFFSADKSAESEETPPHGGAAFSEDTPSQNGKGSEDGTPSQNGNGGYSQNGKGGIPKTGRGSLPETGIQSPVNLSPEKNTGESITGARSRALVESDPAPSLFPVEKTPRQKTSKPASATDESFEAFWSQYPRRESKPDARKAFDAAIKAGANPLEITQGAMRYAAEREREPDPSARHKFTKLPATWLRRECWKDAPPPAPSPSSASSFNGAARGAGKMSWTDHALAKVRRRSDEF